MADTLPDTMEALKGRFTPGKVDRTVTYYLSLGDGEADKWSVTLTPTSCTITPGKSGNADCVLKTSADLFMKMVSGAHKAGPMDFMTGKIKTNDIDLLLRLQQALGF